MLGIVLSANKVSALLFPVTTYK